MRGGEFHWVESQFHMARSGWQHQTVAGTLRLPSYHRAPHVDHRLTGIARQTRKVYPRQALLGGHPQSAIASDGHMGTHAGISALGGPQAIRASEEGIVSRRPAIRFPSLDAHDAIAFRQPQLIGSDDHAIWVAESR